MLVNCVIKNMCEFGHKNNDISLIWLDIPVPMCDHVQTLMAFSSHGAGGGRFKNTYELLNLRGLKFSYVNKINIFQCMGKIFCVEFQRVPPHKKSNPYIERYDFYTTLKIQELLDLRAHMRFWNAPLVLYHTTSKISLTDDWHRDDLEHVTFWQLFEYLGILHIKFPFKLIVDRDCRSSIKILD